MDIMSALKQVVLSIKNWTDENKVQKVSGKGLSSNDYTTEDKEKVDNISNGLVVKNNMLYLSKDGIPMYNGVVLPTSSSTSESMCVQSDWNQTDDTAADFIKNKPVIPESSNCSWSDLIDKPFVPEATYVWDVNAEYDEILVCDTDTFVKISDDVEDDCIFVGSEIVYTAIDEDGIEYVNSIVISEDDIMPLNDDAYVVLNILYIVTAGVCEISDGCSLTRGIWIVDESEMGRTKYTITTCAKTIDESVIPDSIARIESVIQQPVKASVGQTVVIKSVDDTGKPTEWDVADLPIIPAITENDHGKFLMAVDGEFKLVSILNANNEIF